MGSQSTFKGDEGGCRMTVTKPMSLLTDTKKKKKKKSFKIRHVNGSI